MTRTRGPNVKNYHFAINVIAGGEVKADDILYTSARAICDEHGTSRASIYRLLNNPKSNSKCPFTIRKVRIPVLPQIVDDNVV